MKITIIGSTAYQDKMKEHAKILTEGGNEVFIPAFDNHAGLDELGVCAYNLFLIEQADEVHVIWDARSAGTIFDMGMCFALRKPVKIIYLNDKTFSNLFMKYAEFCKFVADTPQEELEELIKENTNVFLNSIPTMESPGPGDPVSVVPVSDVVPTEQIPA